MNDKLVTILLYFVISYQYYTDQWYTAFIKCDSYIEHKTSIECISKGQENIFILKDNITSIKEIKP